jgi:hypothetical protein
MAVHQDRAGKERGEENKFIERTIGVWQSRSRRELNAEDVRQISENTVGFFRILVEWETKEKLSQGENSKKTS